MAETFRYVRQLDMFNTALAAHVAFNAPKEIRTLEPGYFDPVELEDVHPMLRPKARK